MACRRTIGNIGKMKNKMEIKITFLDVPVYAPLAGWGETKKA
jgi:hypothetical protein